MSNATKKIYAQKSTVLILLFDGFHNSLNVITEMDVISMICNIKTNPKIKHCFPNQIFVLKNKVDLIP